MCGWSNTEVYLMGFDTTLSRQEGMGLYRIYTSYSEKKVRERLRLLHFFIFVIIA